MDLYSYIKQHALFHSEEYTQRPRRNKPKTDGYMWEGETELVLTDGRIFHFKMWQHFPQDTGNIDWYPTPEQLSQAWWCYYFPILDKMYPFHPHAILLSDGLYGSIKGVDTSYRIRQELEQSIRTGNFDTSDIIRIF